MVASVPRCRVAVFHGARKLADYEFGGLGDQHGHRLPARHRRLPLRAVRDASGHPADCVRLHPVGAAQGHRDPARDLSGFVGAEWLGAVSVPGGGEACVEVRPERCIPFIEGADLDTVSPVIIFFSFLGFVF